MVDNEELVRLYQNGDQQALEKLIEKNRGIVCKIVNKFYVEGTSSIDRDDLEQEGYIGLITAAERYDFNNEKKAKFITFAVYWIYSKINRFVKRRNTSDEISLNIPAGDEGHSELLDFIEGVDYGFENIEDKLYYQQLKNEIEEVMEQNNTLNEREILKLHYGWDRGNCLSLNDLGDIFGITSERVRQIESKALRKIRSSSWGRNKAVELYAQKRYQSFKSIHGIVESISFAEKYLYNEVV